MSIMATSKLKVKVYSTQTCPYCFKAKDFLRDHNIEFEDIDVGRNPIMAAEMVHKSGQMGVPVIEIGEDIVVGFDVDEIKRLLKLK